MYVMGDQLVPSLNGLLRLIQLVSLCKTSAHLLFTSLSKENYFNSVLKWFQATEKEPNFSAHRNLIINLLQSLLSIAYTDSLTSQHPIEDLKMFSPQRF